MDSCTISPAAHPGEHVTLTYHITTQRAGTVGLGAATYLEGGSDYDYGQNDDTGNKGSFTLHQGPQNVPRQYHIPGGLKAGTYDIDGELWPANKVGTADDRLAGEHCAQMTVR